MILKILKLHSPKGSCNFENFQNHSYLLIRNCTRGRAISYTNCTPLSSITIIYRPGHTNLMTHKWLTIGLKVISQYCIAHPYCARFLRHQRAQKKRVHVHNERNFPQAKPDSEINVRCLLNEHGDL